MIRPIRRHRRVMTSTRSRVMSKVRKMHALRPKPKPKPTAYAKGLRKRRDIKEQYWEHMKKYGA